MQCLVSKASLSSSSFSSSDIWTYLHRLTVLCVWLSSGNQEWSLAQTFLPFGGISRSFIQGTFSKTLFMKRKIKNNPKFWYNERDVCTLNRSFTRTSDAEQCSGDSPSQFVYWRVGQRCSYINRAPKWNREYDCQYKSRLTYLGTRGMKPPPDSGALTVGRYAPATFAL